MANDYNAFKLLEFESNLIPNYKGVLQGLSNRELDGLIVRNLVDKETTSGFVSALESNQYEMPLNKYYWGTVYGRVLTSKLNDLDKYYESALEYNTKQPSIWGPEKVLNWQDFLGSILSMLYDKQANIPHFSNGNSCHSSTIRFLSEGNGLVTHSDNRFPAEEPKFEDLKSISILEDVISYFVLLQKPSSGGELTVFNARWNNKQNHPEHEHECIESIELEQSRTLELDVGDLLVFQGGDIYHRVEPIIGPIPRITIGGFITPSIDNTSVYFWS